MATHSSTSGLLLLLIGSLGLIGFLTGNLDRWLAYLFTPPGSSSSGTNLASPIGATAPPGQVATSANRRGQVG